MMRKILDKFSFLKILAKPRFWIRLDYLLVPTILLTWFLYQPFKSIDIPARTGENGKVTITQSQINDQLSTQIVADLIQTSLDLKWFHLCVKDEGFVSINEIRISGETSKTSTSHIGSSQFQVNAQNENYTLNVVPDETTCILLNSSGDININLGALDTSLGTMSETPSQYFGNKKFMTQYTLDFTKLKISLRNDVLWVLLVKFLLIFLVWSALFFLCRDLNKFLFKQPADMG